jgi:hypothetical protein
MTAGRYIQILQSRDTYANLTAEMVRGDVADLVPKYDLQDPLISQLVSTIANEVEAVSSTRFCSMRSTRLWRCRLSDCAAIVPRCCRRHRTGYLDCG